MTEKRTHFINPYTFVPLADKTVFQAEHLATHALLEANRFTGKIRCSLKFITPAVIPGEQKDGKKNEYPGHIKAYTHQGRLAIPGSRLRGHICNLMRAINSSPVAFWKDDLAVLQRVGDPVRKGYIFNDGDGWKIQEVSQEILVIHKDRVGKGSLLRNGASPAEKAVCYKKGNLKKIVSFPALDYSSFQRDKMNQEDISAISSTIKPVKKRSETFFHIDLAAITNENTKSKLIQATKDKKNVELLEEVEWLEDQIPKFGVSSTPVDGTVFFNNPGGGPGARYRNYLVESGTPNAQIEGKNWVKFTCWSGLDGKSRIPPGDGGDKYAHRNAWHVVDLSNVEGHPRLVSNSAMKKFQNDIVLIARQADKEYSEAILEMANLDEAGTFVYFKTDAVNSSIISFGRHYRYLTFLGTVNQKIDGGNRHLLENEKTCAVKHLSGWADDNILGKNSMKSRIWVEMAMGPEAETLEKKGMLKDLDLRILASQPPKQAAFYLEGGSAGGDYDDPGSRIRGRKFYWHDPEWEKPMWDNDDLKNGRHAFENPDPKNKKLWEQWSIAEVLCASKDDPQEFYFTIRVMNLDMDELYLLLTALTGFDPEAKGGSISPKNNEWCHKIGHARPFLGSAVINVTCLELLDIDSDTWLPCIHPVPLADIPSSLEWNQDLATWRQENFNDNINHKKALERIMHFEGAYENLEPDEGDARITYPLGQEYQATLTWKVYEEAKRPKSYTWFGKMAKKNPLPEAYSGTSQALPVYPPPGNNPAGGRGNRPRTRRKGMGTLGDLSDKTTGKDGKAKRRGR